jgi:hypothetical protein
MNTFFLANSFALIECLVLVTIISIIALFEIPALYRARKRKQFMARCLDPWPRHFRPRQIAAARHAHAQTRRLRLALALLLCAFIPLWLLPSAMAQATQTGQPNFVTIVSNYTGMVLAGGAGTNFNNASNQIVQHITVRQGSGSTWYWSGCGSTANTTNLYTIYFATAVQGTGLANTNSQGVNTNFTTGNVGALASGGTQNFPLSWSFNLNGTNYINVKTNFPATALSGDREIYPVVPTNTCSGNVTNFYLAESHSNQ